MLSAILLVDDEPMIREVLEERLRSLAHKFYHANDGQEAFAVLSKQADIAVVVSDVKMPMMDGLQFIKVARESGFKTPFVFFTAFATKDMFKEIERYGANLIEKGQMDGLIEAVKDAR